MFNLAHPVLFTSLHRTLVWLVMCVSMSINF